MELSIIIPCFNSVRTIATQLDALSKTDWSKSWELLIVDNGSTDSKIDIVRQYHQSFPLLRIIKASDKKGSGYARNVGVNHTEASKILFCDTDDRVSKNWLKTMSEALNFHDFIAGGITLKHINKALRILKESPFGTKDQPQKDVFTSRFNPKVRFAPVCNLGIRKEVHVNVGGLDESIPFNVDYKYCWRISLTGYRLTFISDGLVEYRLRHDLKGAYMQRYKWGKRGTLTYRKHIRQVRVIGRVKSILDGWRHLPLFVEAPL